MSRIALTFLTVGLAATPQVGRAHSGIPRVVDIRFPAQRPGEVWMVSDDLGLYVRNERGFRWLCSYAFRPDPLLRNIVPVGAGRGTWLASSVHGLFRTEDDGCSFELLSGPLAGHVPNEIHPHPERPDEVLVGTETLGLPNDIFLSTDAGRTWQGAGLAIEGRIRRPILRASADSQVVYVAHTGGAARSADGGRTFSPITLGPPELEVIPEEFYLLADHPGSADEVYATVERFPDSVVIRTRDGGRTWEPVLTMEDVPSSLTFDRAGRRGFLVTPFVGVFHSEDGGETWTHEPVAPADLLGCVTREPDSDRLWGCTDVGFNGPWALGTSEDFGRTWTEVVRTFTDVDEPWSCPAETPSGRACNGLCATGPMPVPCDGPGATDAGPPGTDAGPPTDGGGAGRSDAEASDATAPGGDAERTPPTSKGGGGGCSVGAAGQPGLGAVGLALLALARRLRARRRPSSDRQSR